MLTLGVIGWIIIGGLAGWIGGKIMGTDAQMGVVLNVVVGIIGGSIGGFLLRGLGVNVADGGLLFSFSHVSAGRGDLAGDRQAGYPRTSVPLEKDTSPPESSRSITNWLGRLMLWVGDDIQRHPDPGRL